MSATLNGPTLDVDEVDDVPAREAVDGFPSAPPTIGAIAIRPVQGPDRQPEREHAMMATGQARRGRSGDRRPRHAGTR